MNVSKIHVLLTRRKMVQGGVALAATAWLPGCGSSAAAGGTAGTPTQTVVNPQPTPSGPLTAANLIVTATSLGSIGSNFAGLSYEKDSFSSARFSASSTNLIGLFNRLGPSLLRIGGNTVDQYVWTPNGKGKTAGQVAPADVTALAAFLQATGWKCLYGINLAGSGNGTQTTALAAAEALYVSQTLGSSLAGIEIGNECDLYGSATASNGTYVGRWSLSIFETLWNQYRAAIVAAVPGIVVTGPASASSESSWTVPFGQSVGKSEITLLTQHYYRDSGTNSQDTATYLVTPDATLESYLATLNTGAKGIGVPFRMSECNSFYDGGTEGVPDGFGSGLWAIDFLFDCALGGASGVNFHTTGGGTTGTYSAETDSGGTVEELHPEYYGMLFFTLAGTGTLYTTALTAGSLNVTAYAIKTASGLSVVLVNKDPTQNLQLTAALPQSVNTASLLGMTQLSAGASGPSITATTGEAIQGATVSLGGAFTPAASYGLSFSGAQVSCYVPAMSAVLIQIT